MEEKKTHRLVEKPRMSVRFLADYMAASDQVRRTILRDCKYRATARMVQHDDAKLAISKYMLHGCTDPEILNVEAEYIRNKLADDQFDTDCNDVNADYVERFAKVVEDIELPKGAQWEQSKPFAAQDINGLKVTFAPSLLTRRTTRQNTTKRGAMMLRYAKGTTLRGEVGAFQSSVIHGLLNMYGTAEDEQIDGKLCLTICGHSGTMHPAPTNCVSRFNNTKAACATIAEQWDKIKPPPKAVL